MDGVKSLRREKAYHHDKRQSKLPLKFRTKLTEFQSFVIGLRHRNKHFLHQIGNADETAVFQHALHLYCKFQKRKASGNENHRL
jgi:hypothetical protein